ncbi:MAG: PqqD family protein [Candidatus Binatus sp.]
MEKTISPGSIVVASKDQISCDLEGQAAILNLRSGTYFGLDPVGAMIWSLIVQPRRVVEIRNALIEQFDVEAERCSRDLLQLLGELQAHGLIQVLDEPAPDGRGSDEEGS